MADSGKGCGRAYYTLHAAKEGMAMAVYKLHGVIN